MTTTDNGLDTDGTGGLTAVVFPGMGASAFGHVGRFMVLDRYVRARREVADEVLGESLLSGFRAEQAEYGVFSQTAFLVNSLALADRAEQELGMRPDYCVGPSFGQRALMVYSGSLDFAQAIRLTVELAECEHEYFAQESEDLVTQCFVRVPDEPMRQLVDEYAERGEWLEISGYLDRGCYLLSLPERLLEEVVRSVASLGGYRLQAMRPPVHARRFAPLRRKVESEVFARYRFADPALPVVADQDGRMVSSSEELRTMLLDSIDKPIDWPAAVETLTTRGVRTVYVAGPDRLFHRLDCTAENFRVVPVTPGK